MFPEKLFRWFLSLLDISVFWICYSRESSSCVTSLPSILHAKTCIPAEAGRRLAAIQPDPTYYSFASVPSHLLLLALLCLFPSLLLLFLYNVYSIRTL